MADSETRCKEAFVAQLSEANTPVEVIAQRDVRRLINDAIWLGWRACWQYLESQRDPKDV